MPRMNIYFLTDKSRYARARSTQFCRIFTFIYNFVLLEQGAIIFLH